MFIDFAKLKRVRAIDITEVIHSIDNLGLSLCNLRGQGYNGASTMSGEKGGVQAKILEKQPKALYSLCRPFIKPCHFKVLFNSFNQKLH